MNNARRHEDTLGRRARSETRTRQPETTKENALLHSILAQNMEALKESSMLLLKCRPPRPHISSEKKLLVAGAQRFKCAGDRTRCPMWRLNEGSVQQGSFDESGFEIDHTPPWRVAHRSDRSVLQALCHSCHAFKTRMERIAELEECEEAEDAAHAATGASV